MTDISSRFEAHNEPIETPCLIYKGLNDEIPGMGKVRPSVLLLFNAERKELYEFKDIGPRSFYTFDEQMQHINDKILELCREDPNLGITMDLPVYHLIPGWKELGYY